MSGLEDQVINLEDQVKALEAKLSAAYSELNNKDNIVKQHAKVAEEAVSGNTYICTYLNNFRYLFFLKEKKFQL